MILTAQEEYGLRCALSLARVQRSVDGASTLAEVAESEGLTSPYAGKLLRLLVVGGIAQSTRGRSGGYVLARPATEIPVSEVLRVLGGKLYDGEICAGELPTDRLCVHNSDCAVRSLWRGLQGAIDEYLVGISLADLIGNEQAVAMVFAQLSSAAGAQHE